MNDKAQLAEFANEFWNNYIKQKVHQDKSDAVSFYRATVVTNNNNGTVTIKRPFGDSYIVNCADNMTTVSANTQVLVLRFGNGNNNANHLVVAKGDGGFGVLPAANGGTGANNLSSFFRFYAPSSGIDFNNIVNPSIYSISYAVAQESTNIPNIIAGYLVTLNDSSTFNIQFYVGRDTSNDLIYIRKRGSTAWDSWTLQRYGGIVPPFTAPTMISGRATLQKGGYYQVGKRVYVELTLRLDAARAANGQWTYANGFPAPQNGYAPLAAYIASKQTYTASITTSGILSIANGATATAVNDVIYINGTYLTES